MINVWIQKTVIDLLLFFIDYGRSIWNVNQKSKLLQYAKNITEKTLGVSKCDTKYEFFITPESSVPYPRKNVDYFEKEYASWIKRFMQVR